jgi:hypothetical protein
MNSEASTNQRLLRFGLSRTAIVCIVLLLTLSIAILFGIKSFMEWRCRMQGRAQFDVVLYGVQHYRSSCDSYPPASILDENGRPMHSWRVLVEPYIESNHFYEHYDLDEPWDGPRNQRLFQKFVWQPDEENKDDGEAYDITYVRWFYQCGSCIQTPPDDFSTKLVMVVDSNEPLVPVADRFPSSDINRNWQVRLPAGEDLMIVAIQESDIHWMEPRDLSPAELISRISNPSQPTNCCLRNFRSVVVENDETVQFLDEEETLERLQQMQLHSKVESHSDQE